ncbi:PDDEXK family nuclease [Yersinia massiliensis]|uniref:hypothetical protein n=1 Tax=Yersinia massiliensis TaxID=419257 RepID=UPI0011A0B601|nr:hypothetical protein [Yersinia massiliensis]
MTNRTITASDLQWLHHNAELLLLLRQDTPPTLGLLLEISKKMYSTGTQHDSALFDNLIVLAGLNTNKSMDEYCSYPVIAEYLGASILGEAGQPDLLTNDGYPVEVKTGNFDDAALRQLTRYMEKLNVSRGIACGRRLSAELPSAIEFVQIQFDTTENTYKIVNEGGKANA